MYYHLSFSIPLQRVKEKKKTIFFLREVEKLKDFLENVADLVDYLMSTLGWKEEEGKRRGQEKEETKESEI